MIYYARCRACWSALGQIDIRPHEAFRTRVVRWPSTTAQPEQDIPSMSMEKPSSALTIGATEPAACWMFGHAQFDERNLRLTVAGTVVEIEHKPLYLLRHLLRHAGETVTKFELEEAVWPGRVLSDSVLKKCMSRLRRALQDEDESLIRTVRGYGYQLVAPVRVERPADVLPDAGLSLSAGDSPPLRPQWKLLERLGTGGHGEAWLARHDKTRELRVYKFALGADTLDALKREITFYRLLHDTQPDVSGLVRIYDWNLSEAPYFIESEYVAGGNLEAWAQQAGGLAELPLPRRLDLAAQVAEQLSRAHAVGVLHKDLKPANVLVDADADGKPRIKLVDFGSGTLLDSARLEELHITRLGLTRNLGDYDSGTPLYLAPEVLAGQVATIKADVYALGVLLYQLVVGDFHRTLAPGWEQDVADELLRADIAEAAQGNPARRLADAASLALRLRTLDERRARLERERSEQQEAARTARTLERLRASRLGLLAASIALAVGLGLSVWQHQAALTAQHRAEANEAEAKRAAAEADSASEFLVTDVLRGFNPAKNPRVKDMLDAAAAGIDSRFADQPLLAAKVRERLATAYQSLGDFGAATKLDDELWTQVKQAVDANSGLALDIAMHWVDRGSMPTGESDTPFWGKLLALAQARYGTQSLEVGLIQHQLGVMYWMDGHYLEAVRVEAPNVLHLQTVAPDAKLTVRAMTYLAQAHYDLGDYKDAQDAALKAIEFCGHVGSECPDASFYPRSLLGASEVHLGHAEKAEADLTALLAEMRQHRDESDIRLNVTLVFLGELRQIQGRLDEAASLMEKAKTGSYANGRFLGFFAPSLARLYLQQGRLDDAETVIREMTAAYAPLFRQEHTDVSLAKLTLAEVALKRGVTTRARAIVDGFAPERRAMLESIDYYRGRLRRVEGLISRAEGDTAAAQAKLGESAQLFRQVLGSDALTADPDGTLTR